MVAKVKQEVHQIVIIKKNLTEFVGFVVQKNIYLDSVQSEQTRKTRRKKRRKTIRKTKYKRRSKSLRANQTIAQTMMNRLSLKELTFVERQAPG